MTALRLCTFKGLQNLPLYVAQREGFFAARGLEVTVSYTSGSLSQMGALVCGDCDLVQTAPDNVINLNTDPEAFGFDPTDEPRVVMLLGGSVGPLSLYAQPGITEPAQLRGAFLGVDNPSSGFALLMYDLLARAGLARGRDFAVTWAGGTSARLDALQKGRASATMLYAPYDALAAARGFTRLAVSTDYYAAYASLSTAATVPWVEVHAGTITRYIAAMLRALRWIHDPAHADAVGEVLRDEPALALDPALASLAYVAFVAPDSGFGVEAALSEAGLRQVIKLRAAYTVAPRSLGAPGDYYDLWWYRQALAEAR